MKEVEQGSAAPRPTPTPTLGERLNAIIARLEADSIRLRAGAQRDWHTARALMPKISMRGTAIAAGLAAVTLFALHLIGMIAMREGIAAASLGRPIGMPPDFTFEGRTPILALGRAPALEIRRGNTLTATVGSTAALSGEAHLMSPSRVMLRTPDGTLEVIRLGRRTAPVPLLDGIASDWHSAVWVPIATFARGTLFPVIAQVDPLSIPAGHRPRRTGNRPASRGNPPMVSVGAGWTFVGPLWWHRQAASDRRTLVRVAEFAISRRTTTLADWSHCAIADQPCLGTRGVRTSAGTVLASPSEAAAFIAALNTRFGGRYRLASGTEWNLALRSLKIDLAGQHVPELVCLDQSVSGDGPCARPAIRDWLTGSDQVLSGQATTRAAFRIAETVRGANDGRPSAQIQ